VRSLNATAVPEGVVQLEFQWLEPGLKVLDGTQVRSVNGLTSQQKVWPQGFRDCTHGLVRRLPARKPQCVADEETK
jgi:hypothetical protein